MSMKKKKKKHTTQENNGERDEIVNHSISDCNKLAQKEYKSRYDRVGKMI